MIREWTEFSKDLEETITEWSTVKTKNSVGIEGGNEKSEQKF